jgi:hypothetical protein
MNKTITQKNTFWFIAEFDDYHSIHNGGFYLPKNKFFKAIELGNFLPKNMSLNTLYYGLFYSGKKPPVNDVLETLNSIAVFTEDDYSIRTIKRKDINY